MRTWTTMLVLVLASLIRAPAWAEDIEVSFLQAAIFFMSGREPPSFIQMLSDKKATVREVVLTKSGARNVRYDYFLNDSEPCMVYAFSAEPPYAAKRVRFRELPKSACDESLYLVRAS